MSEPVRARKWSTYYYYAILEEGTDKVIGNQISYAAIVSPTHGQITAEEYSTLKANPDKAYTWNATDGLQEVERATLGIVINLPDEGGFYLADPNKEIIIDITLTDDVGAPWPITTYLYIPVLYYDGREYARFQVFVFAGSGQLRIMLPGDHLYRIGAGQTLPVVDINPNDANLLIMSMGGGGQTLVRRVTALMQVGERSLQINIPPTRTQYATVNIAQVSGFHAADFASRDIGWQFVNVVGGISDMLEISRISNRSDILAKLDIVCFDEVRQPIHYLIKVDTSNDRVIGKAEYDFEITEPDVYEISEAEYASINLATSIVTYTPGGGLVIVEYSYVHITINQSPNSEGYYELGTNTNFRIDVHITLDEAGLITDTSFNRTLHIPMEKVYSRHTADVFDIDVTNGTGGTGNFRATEGGQYIVAMDHAWPRVYLREATDPILIVIT